MGRPSTRNSISTAVTTIGPLWWIGAPDQHGHLHFVHQLLA
jgi:hypothetical protein